MLRDAMAAGGIAMISRASNQLCLIVVTLVAARHLAPGDFGILSLATAFVMLSRAMLYTGPFEYLVKTPDPDRSAMEVLAANGLLAGGGGVLIVLISIPAPALFDSPAIRPLMLMLAPTVLIAAAASWQEALILRTRRLASFYAITMAVEILSAVIAIGGLMAGLGLIAIILQTYARSLALALVYGLMLPPPRLRRIDRGHFREILRWSRARYGTVLVAFLSNYSGDFVLGAMLSPAATGLFRGGNRIVTAVADIFIQPARMFAMTILSRRHADGSPPDGRWLRIFSAIGFIGVPGLAGLAVLGDRVAPVMLGPEWGGAGAIISILACTRMMSLLSGVSSTLLIVNDRQKQVFCIQGGAAIAIVVLTIVLAQFGVTGAAAATGIVLSGASVLFARSAGRLAPAGRAERRDAGLAIGLPLVATVAGAMAGRAFAPLMTDGEPGQLLLAVGCGAAGWAGACLIARRPIGRAIHGLKAGGHPSPASDVTVTTMPAVA